MAKVKYIILCFILLVVVAHGDTLGVYDTTGANSNSSPLENVRYGGRITPGSTYILDSATFLIYSDLALKNTMFGLIKESDSTTIDTTIEFAADTVDAGITYQWISQPFQNGNTIYADTNYQLIAWCEDGTGAATIFRLTAGGGNTIWYGTDTYDGVWGASWTPGFIFTDRKIWGYIVVHEEAAGAQYTRRRIYIGGQ